MNLVEIIKSKLGLVTSTKKPAVILDVDSTLVGLGKRFRSIFMAFIRNHPNPPLWAHKAIPHMEAFNHHYSLGKALTLMMPEPEKQAQNPDPELLSFFQDFRPFWEKHFFSDRHMHFDEPYPGAIEFVKEILEFGVDVVYLTGRDRPRTSIGTIQSFRKMGFPLSDNARLVMKPDPSMPDVVFKHKATEMLNSQYQPILFMDNEPENLVMFSKVNKASEIVFFHSIMSPRIPSEKIERFLGVRKLFRLRSFDSI